MMSAPPSSAARASSTFATLINSRTGALPHESPCDASLRHYVCALRLIYGTDDGCNRLSIISPPAGDLRPGSAGAALAGANVALVTGASTGIGRAIALAAANAGADVAITYRSEERRSANRRG